MINNNTRVIFEGIKYCFTQNVDERSLEVIYDTLKCMQLPDSDINTVMFLFAATCAKHFNHGYRAGQKGLHNS